jgi:hypothetical protein
MFKKKKVKTTNKQDAIEPKVTNPSLHTVVVNTIIIISKVIEEYVFKNI